MASKFEKYINKINKYVKKAYGKGADLKNIKNEDANILLNKLLEEEKRGFTDRLKIIAYAFMRGLNAKDTNKLLREKHQEILYARNIFDALFIAALNNSWTLDKIEEAASYADAVEVTSVKQEKKSKYLSKNFLISVRDRSIRLDASPAVTSFVQNDLSGNVTDINSFKKFCDKNTEHFRDFRSRTASVLAEQLICFFDYVKKYREYPLPQSFACKDKRVSGQYSKTKLNVLGDFISKSDGIKLQNFYAAADLFFEGMLSEAFYEGYDYTKDNYAFPSFTKEQSKIAIGQLKGIFDISRELFLITITTINAFVSANEQTPWLAETDVNSMLNICGWNSLDADNDAFDMYIIDLIENPNNKKGFNIDVFVFKPQNYLVTRNTTIKKALKQKKTKEKANDND